MTRPRVDVVVPFLGTDAQLATLRARLDRLVLAPTDTLTIVDNRPGDAGTAGPHVVRAPERQSSYHARNRGAANGTAPWLVFLDADVVPTPGLVDRYFEPPPPADVGVLAGGVEDEPPDDRGGMAGRYAVLARSLSQDHTLRDEFPYAQTANAAVRRAAFEQVGGFEAEARSGGDADLCFRLARAGWGLESRPAALVRHKGRSSLRALLRQQGRHGAGSAWLEARYPGFSPPQRLRGRLAWLVRGTAKAVGARARGDRDAAIRAFIAPANALAFELGRRLPNGPGSLRSLLARRGRDLLARRPPA